MTSIKYNNHDPVKKVIKYDQKYNIGLCFGLAPNPFGFTFETTGDKRRDRNISYWLHEIELSESDTMRLRKYMRGETNGN